MINPLIFTFQIWLLALMACYGQDSEEELANNKIGLSGKQLSEKYCSTCHLFPEPQLLEKQTWENGVLPNMALRLGLKIAGKSGLTTTDPVERAIIEDLNIYPEGPLLSERDWIKIVDHYLDNAPEKMPAPERSPINPKTNFPFDEQWVTIDEVTLPQVTLLKYDERDSLLYIGDNRRLYALSHSGELKNNVVLTTPASDIQFPEDSKPLLLNIGKLAPSDQNKGNLSRLGNKVGIIDSVEGFSKLKRPVNFELGDLNADGKDDFILCSFGHNTGKLSWFDDLDPSKERILSQLPGTRKVAINDFNQDGRPDIIAMMTQAYEQINIYYNQGDGNFKEQQVLEFSPVHGLSYFELADFNGDGHQDILVTNGDNRDFSSSDKPYHGVRIYLNDGSNNFKEAYFFPMYDCSKAMARDFDNDGDLDIVAAALYSEYSTEKKFGNPVVYLINSGNNNFNPAVPANKLHGNWLTMEVVDFNQDGLLDVMLGAFLYDVSEMVAISSATGLTSFPQILLLTQKK